VFFPVSWFTLQLEKTRSSKKIKYLVFMIWSLDLKL